MDNRSNLDTRLKVIKEEYKNNLPNKVAAISSNWSSFHTTWQIDILSQLIIDCHTLKGSSGTFGFSEVSKAASELETQLNELLFKEKTSEKHDTSLVNDISLTIINIIEAIRNLNGKEMESVSSNTVDHKSPHPIGTAKNCLIYYLDEDIAAAKALAKQLSAYGFTCKHFSSTVDLLSAIRVSMPSLVILDLTTSDDQAAQSFAIAKSIIHFGSKVFVLSGGNNFENQLSAVRAGVHAYIEKSSGIAFIVSRIRTVLQLHGNRPSKILIVDDQRSVAEYYAVVLRDAGMEVYVETTPSNVLHIIHDSMPDLVLLDLNMPDVSGLELAAIIRQEELFQSIPIVFLTASEMQKKSSLLELATDVLYKHEITMDEFVLQIKSRVNRAKTLASKMYMDSLTGLLNHAQVQRSLEKEFLRSRRYNTQLSVAMIDIDKFKTVNDTYGHPVGDKVILALSNLLDQRLRSTDYIGRFGGEEFLVIMPNCTVDNAGMLINKLRVIFAELKFEANGTEFSVSFSAGISGAESVAAYIEQLKQADDALYQAKAQGRNLVCANYKTKKQA